MWEGTFPEPFSVSGTVLEKGEGAEQGPLCARTVVGPAGRVGSRCRVRPSPLRFEPRGTARGCNT